MSAVPSPRLAVVIPTYNRAATVVRAVASVLSEPCGDIELVVVDDCSTDNTLDLLGRIADPRLRVARTERHGYANHARNLGAARTTAPLIAFLDSDDEFQPGRIARLIEFFAARPDADAALDGFHVVHRSERRSFAPPLCAMAGDTLVRMLVCHALPLTNSAITVRRRAFDDIAGFDGDLRRHQDRDLLLRLAPRHRLLVGTGCDVIKHQSPDSVSRDASGYVSGLDALVARHPVFTKPWARDILGYLVARCIIHEAGNGRLDVAWRLARTVRSADSLGIGVASALARYRTGRRLRRQAEAELAAMGTSNLATDPGPVLTAQIVEPAKQRT